MNISTNSVLCDYYMLRKMINKKQQRKIRLINDDAYNPYYHKECVCNCNYHHFIASKSALKEEKYSRENRGKIVLTILRFYF